MEKINSYKDLIVWQKSIELVELIYKLTKFFPKDELFGITSQIRRASVSIPSNIAEGRGRGTRKDFCQFIRIAFGSASELETQLIISKRLLFGNKDEYYKVEQLLEELSKMLSSIIKKLQAST